MYFFKYINEDKIRVINLANSVYFSDNKHLPPPPFSHPIMFTKFYSEFFFLRFEDAGVPAAADGAGRQGEHRLSF